MSELRDRIISALLSLRCELGEPCEECRICAAQDADAVIAALKLHVVTVGDFQTVIKGSYPKPLEAK